MNKEIKNTNSNPTPLEYKGEVTIKSVFGDKLKKTRVYRNEATPLFFRIILASIGGSNMSSSMPWSIQTKSKIGTGEPELTIPEGIYIPWTSKNLENLTDTSLGQIKFTFLIPYSVLIENKKTNYISLYNRNNENLANVVLDPIDEFQYEVGKNFIVEWVISLSNKEKTVRKE